MPAYMIVRGTISDPEAFGRYREAVSKLVPLYGAKYLARGAAALILEGDVDPNERIVIEEYPSVEKIREMWESPEYQEIKKLREGAGDLKVVVMEGEAS